MTVEVIPAFGKIQNNSIAIIGWHEGGAGQIHSWLEKYSDYKIACFVNIAENPLEIDIKIEKQKKDAKQFDFPLRDSFKGMPLITTLRWVAVLKNLGISKVLILTPDKRKRWQHINQAKENGLELISAIHPSAIIMEDAILHEGIVLHAKAFVGYRAELYPGVFINTNAQVDHHNVIRHCAMIDPGVVTAGNVTIGEYSHAHTRAVIINRIRIGKNSILGAGTVVIRDVPDNVTVVGVPGKIIKSGKNI